MYMTETRSHLDAFHRSIILQELLRSIGKEIATNGNSGLVRKQVKSFCNSFVPSFLLPKLKTKLSGLQKEYNDHIKENEKKSEITELERHIIEIKKFESLNIDTMIDNDGYLHINFKRLDLSMMDEVFFDLLKEELKRRCKDEHGKIIINNVVIHFGECVVGQYVFDVVKSQNCKPNEGSIQVADDHEDGINMPISFEKFFFKNVNLSEYDLRDLINVRGEKEYSENIIFSRLLKNSLNYATLVQILERRGEYNTNREVKDCIKLPSLDFRGLKVDELRQLYQDNSEIQEILGSREYNRFKLNKDQVQKILTLEPGEFYLGRTKGDLHGFDLSGLDLSELDVTDASLTKANLAGANLTGTNLFCANLMKANLAGANLAGADLSYASLNRANLAGANLVGANLVDTNLDSVDLSYADLTCADVSYSNLRCANLTGVNFTSANLTRACLIYTNLDDVNFTKANLSGAGISKEHVKIILNLKERETFLGREKGDLNGFNLRYIDSFDEETIKLLFDKNTNLNGVKFNKPIIKQIMENTISREKRLQGLNLESFNHEQLFQENLDGCTVDKDIVEHLIENGVKLVEESNPSTTTAFGKGQLKALREANDYFPSFELTLLEDRKYSIRHLSAIHNL